jgi:undecaprenyl phosphate N,N'-diacetylbacillosamine 1-phosphate transferase
MVYKTIGKRFFDIFFSIVLIAILSPIMLIVLILLIILRHSPIIFVQKRPGYHKQIFKVFKFATMKNTVNNRGELLADEERITVLGNLLRKTSLDELPQLFNVLKGDMSFVGPRPLLIEYLTKYNKEQERRHTVKPGITGYAQINGRNNISWQKKFELDIYYVDNYSLILDLKILFQTLFNVIKRSDISKKGFVTSDKFFGND